MIKIIYESKTYTIEENDDTDLLKELLKKYGHLAHTYEIFELVENQKLKCVSKYRDEILAYTKRLEEKNPHLIMRCYRPSTYPFEKGYKEPIIGNL